MFVIPFTFALMSTVRYSSMNACFNSAIDELNNVFQAASQEMYNAQQQQGGAQQGAPHADQQQQTNNGGKDQEVTDVDFEEVK